MKHDEMRKRATSVPTLAAVQELKEFAKSPEASRKLASYEREALLAADVLALLAENEQLTKERDSAEGIVRAEREANRQLVDERDALKAENAKLRDELALAREFLADKR